MGKEFLHDLNIHGAGQIQFKTTAGANAGKINQDGNNLVLTNAVGDILLGDGSSDVFIGDGTNNVDIVFEQSGSIKGDGSAVTLTLGGANTTLNLENPNFSGAVTMNSKLTFTTTNGFILFDYEPSGDTGEYATEVPLIKVDRSGEESTILARISEYRGIALGIDDTTWIRAGDTSSVIRSNVNLANEVVLMSAEQGFHAYAFPSNDTTWSNRNEFRFYGGDATASNNGLYIGDGGNTQFIDLSRNLKNIGTISNTGDVTITNGNVIFSSQYGVRFNDANTRIYTNTDSPEDLLVEADQDILLTPDGQVNVHSNLVLSDNSYVISARKFTARDGNGVMLTADDASSGLTIADNGNATFSGTVSASNLSGTNTGDQTLPTASSLGAVTLTGAQTISGNKTFTGNANQFNGHLYFNAYDANGNHYPHFRDGSNSNGANVNIRQYYGSASYKTHVMSSDSSGNMQFDFQGTLKGDALTIDGGVDINGNTDISGTLGTGRITINSNSDNILNLNQTSSDNKWNYINFNNQGTREWFIGQDSDGNFDLYNDNINAYAITVALSDNSILLNDNTTVSGTLTVTGNLDITGDINSTSVNNLDVVDKLITVGKGQTEANSNGSGIFVDGSSASLLWDESNNTWDFNKSLDVVGNINTSGNVTANQINLNSIGDYITFYGGGETNHSITSRQLDGGTGDDIRINTYGSFIVNLDSNNNQSTAANSSFFIGRHGSNASAIGASDQIFTVDGQNGHVTATGDITTSGNIILSGASNEIIKSNGSIRLNIDSDANQTDRIFIVSTGANSELFRVNESGNGTFQGSITSGNDITAPGDLSIRGVAASGNIIATASNATISAAESGGATTKIMGASVGRVGTSSNHNLEVLSNNTAAITIDTSQNSTFAGHVKIASTKYLEFAAMGKLINMDVGSWGTGAQEHNILYSGWTTATADYLSIKVAGNSTTNHGNLIISDNLLSYGRLDATDNAAATDSATNPHGDDQGPGFLVTNTGDATFGGGATFGGVVQTANGSASAPAYSFSGDTNTGIYRSAADTLNVSINGGSMLAVNSSGITSGVNVYTGTSGQFRNYAGVWKATTGQAGGDAQFILNGKTIMHIDEADERVGIGTTSPSAKLNIVESGTNAKALTVDDGTSFVSFVPSLGGGGYTGISNAGDIGLIFSIDGDNTTDTTNGLLIAPHTQTSGGLKILENGNVGIGIATPSEPLDVNGTARMDNGIVEGTIYVGDTVTHWGDGGTALRFNTDEVLLQTASTTALTINSSQNATFGGDVSIPVAKKLYFGGGSHTYIGEDIDDRLRFFTGGTEFMRFTEDTSDTINFYTDATFAADVQAQGLYVGSTNTSYDFYNNGTSYLNGATTVDDNLTVNGNIIITGTVDGVDISGLPTFTTVGTNFAQLGNVSVPSYIRINADETLSYLNAAQFLTAIGGVDGTDYLRLAGGTITGDLIISHTDSSDPYVLKLAQGSNGGGAGIQFNDNPVGTQKGYILHRHTDSASYGGGASFQFISTEDDLVLSVGNADATHGRVVVWSGQNNAEPDYGFAQDIDTGMLRTGANAMRFVTGGSAVLDLDSSQNATFASQVTASEFYVVNNNFGLDTDSNYLQIRGYDGYKFYNTQASAVHLTINSSGNATFAGDISLSGDIKGRSVPIVIHASLDDTTSTTSSLIIPLAGSITETTVSGGYAPHFFITPYACVLKKVIFKNVAGSVSSSFTTELKAYKNGSVTGNSSSGELTSSSSSITWNPTAHNDITYAAGDKFSLVYQKSATSKYWQDVAITIVFTLTGYDI